MIWVLTATYLIIGMMFASSAYADMRVTLRNVRRKLNPRIVLITDILMFIRWTVLWLPMIIIFMWEERR